MPPTFFPTRAHVLVCTGPDCTQRGARELHARVTTQLEARKLAYYKAGGSIRLTEAGCLGACAHGPNACAYFDAGDGALRQAWYAGVTAEDVVALAAALHAGEEPPGTKRFDR
jgi:(2Fe-2S) ferredoxin